MQKMREAIMNEEYITKLTKILESKRYNAIRAKTLAKSSLKPGKENLIKKTLYQWLLIGVTQETKQPLLNGFKGKE